MHKASCNCGGVTIEVDGPLREILYCHCSQCRKQTGHFYAATNAETDRIRITGEDNITWYAASPRALRGFCRICGSALFWRANGSSEISIMAGLFEQPSGLVGGEHIYVADKPDYYTINDGLPQKAQW